MTTIWVDAQLPPAIAAWVTDNHEVTAVAVRTFEECDRLIKEGLVIHLTGLLSRASQECPSAS